MNELKVRYVIESKLLGQDKEGKKRSREKEYAIQATLSDESQYTMFRTLKDIAVLHSRIMSRFPVEAGYFKKGERVIPECPVKQTIFGPQRSIRDDRSFEKLLNSYIKEIPGMPASIVKCDLISDFFSLKASDIIVPGSPKAKKKSEGKRKKSNQVYATEDSTISGPMSLRSYYTVASYSDKKSKFSVSEGAVVQVMKKDPGGWWMIDAGGSIGWAPASYLVPVDAEDLHDEAQENEQLIEKEKVGARYISISKYQSSRDDELSFVRGAVVKVIKKHVDGWWLVRYNGGEGYVPGALFRKFDKRQATVYVKKIRRNFISRKSTRIIPTIKPKWLGVNDKTKRGSASPPKEDKPSLILYQCKAVFQGSAERFELSLNKYDTVKVIDKKDHGWWYAEDLHGRSGWVPATYLRQVLDKEATRLANGENIIGTVYEVLQSHTAQREDELGVERGEKVEVVVVSVDGWWVVRHVETKAQGLVPSVCLTMEAENGDEGESPDDLLATRSEPVLGQSDLVEVADLSSQSASAMDKWTDKQDDDLLDDLDMEDDMDGCFVATSDYSKEAIDELDLYEGQVVCVIDDSDKDVWYVNCDGKEGWVPSNILREFVDEHEIASSGESTPNDLKFSSNGASSEDSDVDDHRRTICRSKVIHRPVSHDPQQTKKHPPILNGGANRRTSTDSGNSGSTSPPVTIMVDNKSLAELEREVAEAERKVLEARQLAVRLKQKVELARSVSSPDERSRSPSPHRYYN